MRPFGFWRASFLSQAVLLGPARVARHPRALLPGDRQPLPGRLRIVLWAALSLLLSAAPLHAVVIINPDLSFNNGQTSDPGTGVPYANIGISPTGHASVTYLGNQWGILDAHESTQHGGTVTVRRLAPIRIQSNPTVPVTNSDNSATDLELIHLSTSPGLPSLLIPTPTQLLTAPSPNQVVMIGRGLDIAGPEQSISTPDNGNWPGYPLTMTMEANPRWGTNDIDAGSITLAPQSAGQGTEYEFTTSFKNTPTASDQEALATNGDSGGGAFEQIGGAWYLTGLMDEVINSPTADPNTAEYNAFFNHPFPEQTVIGDLAFYRGTIATTTMVPEPSGHSFGRDRHRRGFGGRPPRSRSPAERHLTSNSPRRFHPDFFSSHGTSDQGC